MNSDSNTLILTMFYIIYVVYLLYFYIDKEALIMTLLQLSTSRINYKNEQKSIDTIQFAIENGINYINSAEFYNGGASEIILSKALTNVSREKYKIFTKYNAFPKLGSGLYGIDPNPFNIRAHLKFSLKRLCTNYIDVYEPSHQDKAVPVEDIVFELGKLQKEGQIKEIALSEVDETILERANKIQHIDYVEMEYSIIHQNIERGLLQTAKRLEIKVIAYELVFT